MLFVVYMLSETDIAYNCSTNSDEINLILNTLTCFFCFYNNV